MVNTSKKRTCLDPDHSSLPLSLDLHLTTCHYPFTKLDLTQSLHLPINIVNKTISHKLNLVSISRLFTCLSRLTWFAVHILTSTSAAQLSLPSLA